MSPEYQITLARFAGEGTASAPGGRFFKGRDNKKSKKFSVPPSFTGKGVRGLGCLSCPHLYLSKERSAPTSLREVGDGRGSTPAHPPR